MPVQGGLEWEPMLMGTNAASKQHLEPTDPFPRVPVPPLGQVGARLPGPPADRQPGAADLGEVRTGHEDEVQHQGGQGVPGRQGPLDRQQPRQWPLRGPHCRRRDLRGPESAQDGRYGEVWWAGVSFESIDWVSHGFFSLLLYPVTVSTN